MTVSLDCNLKIAGSTPAVGEAYFLQCFSAFFFCTELFYFMDNRRGKECLITSVTKTPRNRGSFIFQLVFSATTIVSFDG